GLLLALAVSAVALGFIGLWYAVGRWAGILWTRRALWLAAVAAAFGVATPVLPWGLDAMLLADALLALLVWLDARLAPPAGQMVRVSREAPPAYSVGHAGLVTYRWSNAAGRRARLGLRESRPHRHGCPVAVRP